MFIVFCGGSKEGGGAVLTQFLSFSCSFHVAEFLLNNRLASPSGKSWIRHCHWRIKGGAGMPSHGRMTPPMGVLDPPQHECVNTSPHPESTQKQWRIQDFPEGGANSQIECANLLFYNSFCLKLHENERIWTPRGRASLAPPRRSATEKVSAINQSVS